MTAREVIERLNNKSIKSSKLMYCLVDSNKHPYKLDDTPARTNTVEDFVDFDTISKSTKLDKYAGIGISIQASNICAIDVDHCFSIANDITSADERAKYCLDIFKDVAYCEFSFSGTGLRILFKHPVIINYSDKLYIKNDKTQIEYYQPNKSYRYVTLTGNTIVDNDINIEHDITNVLFDFLDKYMTRNFIHFDVQTVSTEETRSYEELMQLVKKCYRKDMTFQNLWFVHAPGSGKDESERDYHLVAYLYENITQNKDMIKKIFETSTFFKTKDSKHVYKWTYQNGRYFDYLYEQKRRQHEENLSGRRMV